MYEADFSFTIRAPVEQVFAKVSDHRHFFRGFPIRYCYLESEGTPAPNGLGAVRVVRNGLVRFVERITHFEPNVRLDYLVTECTLPVRHDWGRTDFIVTPEGTTVRWRTRFTLAVPILRRTAENAFAATLKSEILRLLKQVQVELEGS